MHNPTRTKKPSEKVPLGIDIKDIPPPIGETIQSGSSIVVVRMSDGVDVTTSIMVTGSLTISGTQIKALFNSGTDGENYRIRFNCITQTCLYIEDIQLSVRDSV